MIFYIKATLVVLKFSRWFGNSNLAQSVKIRCECFQPSRNCTAVILKPLIWIFNLSRRQRWFQDKARFSINICFAAFIKPSAKTYYSCLKQSPTAKPSANVWFLFLYTLSGCSWPAACPTYSGVSHVRARRNARSDTFFKLQSGVDFATCWITL